MPAACQPAMPWRQTSVAGPNAPARIICCSTATGKGPVDWPFTATLNCAGGACGTGGGVPPSGNFVAACAYLLGAFCWLGMDPVTPLEQQGRRTCASMMCAE